MARAGRAVSLRTSGTGIWLEQPAHAISLRSSNLGMWLAGLLALAGAALLAYLVLVPGRQAAAARAAIPAVARVTDLTGTLDADEQNALTTKLADFEHAGGAQLAVLILPSTRPETIEQYGIRLAEAWKLGRKGVDDGAILIVAKDDHKLRIEVGYGLEGSIPDAVASRIIEETIVPAFKTDHFYQGINAGVDRIIHAIQGDDAARTQQATAPQAGDESQPESVPGPAAASAATEPTAGADDAGAQQQLEEWERRSDLAEHLLLWLIAFSLVFPLVAQRWLGRLGASFAAGCLFTALGLLLSWLLAPDMLNLVLIGGPLVALFAWAGISGWNSGGSGGFSSSSSGSSSSFSGGGGGFGGGGASGSW
jgi:uncharacterized protein